MSVSGKVVVIPGGAGALGQAACRVFLEAGARVVAADREASGLSALLGEEAFQDRLSFRETDVLSEQSVLGLMQDTRAAHGSVDALLQIVGGYAGANITDTSLDVWDRMMALNARSAFLCVRHVLPIMQSQKFGRIVAVGARPAVEPAAGSAAYAASKAAVVHLIRTAALEGKEFGITANAVLPGVIDTPINRASMPKANFADWTSAERIARVMLFLCSGDAGDTSGALIPVYGRS